MMKEPDSGNRLTNSVRPKVSVLMPAYGQAAYISDAIKSVMGQTYDNWELAIVDDGSPDKVESIVAPYLQDHRIRFYHTANRGVSAARNYAASVTDGDLIISLDADDILAPDYIEKCVARMEEHPEIKVVYSQWRFFGESSYTVPLAPCGYRDLLTSNRIYCSAMCRRVDFARIGGFDEKMLTGYEDWEFWIRLLNPFTEESLRNDENSESDNKTLIESFGCASGNYCSESDERLYMIEEPLFFYRIKKVSRSKSADLDGRKEKCHAYIYAKHQSIYEKMFPDMLSRLVELNNLRRKCDKWRRRNIFSRIWHALIGIF